MSGRAASPRTVRMEVRFPGAPRARSCLAQLSRIPGVLLHILRGRVTATEAVYELEVSGRGAGVQEAIGSLRAAAACP